MGFVAGTLVHTDKGLVPIEAIQIGDLVLSKFDEGANEPIYKPVIRTIVTECMEVCAVRCVLNTIIDEPREPWSGISEDRLTNIVVTDNHPFFVEGKGLVQAKKLDNDLFELVDGGLATTWDGGESAAKPIYHISGDHMGWILHNNEFHDEENVYYSDFDLTPNVMRVPEGHNREPNKDQYIGWYHDFNQRYTCVVYDIDVAETHTYFIGDIGVWVSKGY